MPEEGDNSSVPVATTSNEKKLGQLTSHAPLLTYKVFPWFSQSMACEAPASWGLKVADLDLTNLSGPKDFFILPTFWSRSIWTSSTHALGGNTKEKGPPSQR